MYNGHAHRIPTAQLQAQVDMLELAKAKRRAALALDLNPDYPSMVRVEMAIRKHDALSLMDWVIETHAKTNNDFENWVAETQELRHG